MAKAVLAKDVFEWTGLIVSPRTFRCSYCGKTWEREGSAQGFVKSGARSHVYNCWQVGLFLRGYVVGEWSSRGDTVLTIAEAEKREAAGEIHKGYVASYKRSVARRRREGVLGVLMPPTMRVV